MRIDDTKRLFRASLRLTLAFAFLALCMAAGAAKDAGAGGARVALVIGNSAYKNTDALRNPVNDANDMAAALKRLGFDVILKRNASLREMKDAAREFGRRLNGSEVALVFYAGHGVQIKGQNFLIPVEAQIETEADAEDASMRVEYLTQTMEDGGAKLNILVLDACRNNPFARSFRSLSRGLAPIQAGSGTLIEYSTAAGSVAGDGDGHNGTFTKHLLKTLAEDDSEVLQVFRRTRERVAKETAGKQVPFESSSLIGDFFFKQGANSSATSAEPADRTAVAAIAPDAIHVQSADELEQSFWNRVRDSTDAADFTEYQRQFPHGLHSAEASLMERKLTRSSSNSAAAKSTDSSSTVALSQPSSPARSAAPPPPPGGPSGPPGTFPGYITSSLNPGETINGYVMLMQNGSFQYQGDNGTRVVGMLNLSNPGNVTGVGTAFLPKLLGLLQMKYRDGSTSTQIQMRGQIVNQVLQGQFGDKFENGQFVFNLARPN